MNLDGYKFDFFRLKLFRVEFINHWRCGPCMQIWKRALELLRYNLLIIFTDLIVYFLLLLFIIASDFSRIKEINWLCIEYITCTLLLTLSNSKLPVLQLFCRHASQFMIKSSTCELPLHRLSWTMVCSWKKTITLRRPSRYKLMGFYATFCIYYISIIIHVLVMLYFSPLFFFYLKIELLYMVFYTAHDTLCIYYFTWFSVAWKL